MNTYDDVFGVSTKKSEQVGGGQRGSAFRFWRRRKNWRMLQGKANPIALACRDLTSFCFLLLFFYSAAGAASPASASSVAASDVQRVKLSRRSCLINGSLGELASLLGRVEDLIVEDGEVERQTEAN